MKSEQGQAGTPKADSRFGPVLLAGLAVRPLPLAPLQPVLNGVFKQVLRRHPGLFDRLDTIANKRFRIEPTDLPFAFILNAESGAESLRAVPAATSSEVAATISGPLMALLALLEGETDGDAQFFNRDIIIDGDTEAVVALRNCLDSAELDLAATVLGALGPLQRPAQNGLSLGRRLLNRAQADLDLIQNAMTRDLRRKIDAQAATIRKLDEKVKQTGRAGRRQRA